MSGSNQQQAHSPEQELQHALERIDALERTNAVLKERLRELQQGSQSENSMVRRHVEQLNHQLLEVRQREESYRALSNSLQESNYYTKSILDSITEALFVTSREGFIEQLNPAAERLLDYSAEDLLGKSIAELFVEEESEASDDFFFSVDSPLDQLLRTGKGRGIELMMLSRTGSEVPVMISGEIAQPSGQEEYIVIAAQDARERKRMEEEAQFNAFQSGVAEMSTTILHNIGNAVTGLYGSSTKIIKQGKVVQKISSMLNESGERARNELSKVNLGEADPWINNIPELMSRSGQLLDRVVAEEVLPSAQGIEEGVIHISEIIRIQKSASGITHATTSFRLKELMENIMVMQQEVMEKYQVEVVMDLEAVSGKLMLPRNQLIQLLLNLLKNSREAIVEHSRRQPELAGKIELKAVPLEEGSGQFQLCVSDNGCGITKEGLSKVFNHGFTTKLEGSGFGLHSAANFVNKLGGKMMVDSDGVDQGARVCIQLPFRVE